MILLLGPNKPPFEYIANLQKIVQNENNESVNRILDQDFSFSDWIPSLIDNKRIFPLYFNAISTTRHINYSRSA